MSKVHIFNTKKDAAKTLESYYSHNAAVAEEMNRRATYITPTDAIGKGLEAVCLVNLSSIGKSYKYRQNYGYSEYSPQDYFKTLEALANDLKESLPKTARQYTTYGASVTQILYTVREEIPIISDEKKQELREFLDTPEVAEDINTLPLINRIVYKLQVRKFKRDMLNCKDTECGLTAQEIAEFEMLYF